MIIRTEKRYQLSILLILAALCGAGELNGQESKKTEIADPETVFLVTKDGVELRAEWFPGKPGKNSVPVILLHDWNGSRQDLYGLATYLHRERGCSVLVPDMRGHGDSISLKNSDETIKRDKFRKSDFLGFVEDIETCKRFLVSKNNLGDLNIDLLVIGAVGKMSPFAVDYALRDWTWEPLGGIKQGQDVKAIVMISPERKFKSASMTPAFKIPLISGRNAEPLPIYLTWGSRHSSSSREGNSIYSTLSGSREKVSSKLPVEQRWKKQTLFKILYKSNLTGRNLLKEQGDGMSSDIGLFIEKKVAGRKDDFRWQDRSRK
ncbi:MAG: alpha/beta hydrolase [Mariniblastus sp.]|nr:alpha/beta hydrolase [Mariniblastus sp.]